MYGSTPALHGKTAYDFNDSTASGYPVFMTLCAVRIRRVRRQLFPAICDAYGYCTHIAPAWSPSVYRRLQSAAHLLRSDHALLGESPTEPPVSDLCTDCRQSRPNPPAWNRISSPLVFLQRTAAFIECDIRNSKPAGTSLRALVCFESSFRGE